MWASSGVKFDESMPNNMVMQIVTLPRHLCTSNCKAYSCREKVRGLRGNTISTKARRQRPRSAKR